MAHNLEFYNGTAQVMGLEPAWHKLGTVMPEGFKRGDVERHVPTFLMPVRKVPAYAQVGVDKNLRPVYSRIVEGYATVREDNKVLGYVGEQYTIVQGEALWELGERMGLKPSTVGVIKEGRWVFMSFDAGSMDIGGDVYGKFFNVVSSHDGTLKLTACRNDIRQVCNNTVSLSLSMGGKAGTGRFVFRHTTNIADGVRQMAEMMHLSAAYDKAVADALKATLKVKMPMRAWDMMLDSLWPEPDSSASKRAITVRSNIVDTMYRLRNESPMVKPWAGTGYGAVQAVNTWENWLATVKGAGDDEAKRMDVRAERQIEANVVKGQPWTDRTLEYVLSLS